jgi:hypothetical protein
MLVTWLQKEMLSGRTDVRKANPVGYLAMVMLKALQQGDIEARLRALEAALAGPPTRH